MTNERTRLDQLPAATSAATNDLLWLSVSDGGGGYVDKKITAGNLGTGGGGGGTPGGSTTQVQYNNAGSFGGITGATTDGTTLTLVAPVLGTPASGTATNLTGLPLSSGVTGQLPIANGGTAGTTAATARTNLGLGTLTYPLMNYGGMNFDGSTDYLDTNPLTGIADGKKGTFELIFEASFSATTRFFSNTETSFEVRATSAGNLVIVAENAAGTTILSATSTTPPFAAGGLFHLVLSYDMATAGSLKVYVNDVDVPMTETTFTNDTIDYTVAEYSVGATTAGASLFTGNMYRLWFDPTSNIDFDVEANRRKFTDPNGVPVYLGYYGSLPTGSKPILFLGYEAGLAWAVNRGSATSTFTINGTPIAATTALSGQFEPKAINNLMGAATLASGTIAVTISGLTTSDRAFVQLTTPGGTMGAGYKAVCTTDTLTITSIAAAGTTVTTDTSTLNYMILKN